jgi:hypothetical protein
MRMHTDVAIALAIVAFCAVVYGITLTFDTVPESLAVGMGPEAFPRLVLGTMVVLAGVMAWASRGRPDPARERVPGIVYATALSFVAFMALMGLVGFIIAIPVGVVGMGFLWHERRRKRLFATAIGLAVTVWLIFDKGFGIPLPRGLLGDWLS